MAHSVVSTALTMNVDDLVRGVNTANASLQKLTAQSAKTSTFLTRMSKKFMRALDPQQLVAYGTIATKIFSMVRASTISFIDAQIRLVKTNFDVAYSLGLSYNQFQALNLAAQQAGLTFERLYEPISKVARKIDDALRGSTTSVQNFGRLGLNVQALSEATTYNQFKAVVDAINAIPNASERAALAMNIFEESGAKFLQLFSVGSEGLKKFEMEAKRLGITLDNLELARLLQANKAIINMKNALFGLKTAVVTQIAPLVTVVSDYLTKTFTDENFVGKIADMFQAVVTNGIRILADFIDGVVIFFNQTERVLGKFEKLLDGVGNLLRLPLDLFYGVLWGVGELEKALSVAGTENIVTKIGDWGKDRFAGKADSQGGSTWGSGVRKLVGDFEAGFAKPISDSIQRLVTEQASGKYRLQPELDANTEATRQLTVATQQNTQAMSRLSQADDIRTGAGIESFLRSSTAGYGEAREVTLLEKIAKSTEKMAKQQAVPAVI